MAREHPDIVSLRVTPIEKKAIEAIAAADGVPSSEFLRSVVVPAVAARLSPAIGRSATAPMRMTSGR